jgi:hypothetical protein
MLLGPTYAHNTPKVRRLIKIMTQSTIEHKSIRTGSTVDAGRRSRAWYALREAGISQQRVADVAGCSRAMVSLVLSGRATSAHVQSTIRQLLDGGDLFAPPETS